MTIVRIIMNTSQYLPQTAYRELIKSLEYVDMIESDNIISFRSKHDKYILEFYTHLDNYKFAIEDCGYFEGKKWISLTPTEKQLEKMKEILAEKYRLYQMNIDEMRQEELQERWDSEYPNPLFI